MEQLIFTSIKDIDQSIIEELDIESLITLCQTNKQAFQLCQNNQLWINKFKSNNIIIRSSFRPKSSMDWINYYNRYHYIKWITLKGNWQHDFQKIDKAIDMRNNIIMIGEIDDDLDYRHITIDIKNNIYQSIYKAMENITYANLYFDEVYEDYQQFRFKYRKNEYWLFFNIEPVEFTEYPDNMEDSDLEPDDSPEEYRVRLTEDEFKLMLTLIIYDDNYTDIYDHDKRSYLIWMLTEDDDHNLKRIGMLEVFNYLHDKKLLL